MRPLATMPVQKDALGPFDGASVGIVRPVHVASAEILPGRAVVVKIGT